MQRKLALVFISCVTCLTLPLASTIALDKAPVSLKNLNQTSILKKQTPISQNLLKSLIAQNQPTDALEISERGRERGLVDLLAQSLPTKNADTPRVEEIKQVAKSQNATLVQYSLLQADVTVDGKRQTQDSELVIWVIPPNGEISLRKVDLQAWQQKSKRSLADLIKQIQPTSKARNELNKGIIKITESKQSNSDLTWKQLHQLLIQPIADLLPENPDSRVIFIPQDKLFLVPFAALQDENNKYLIEKYTISTVPAIQVLDLLAKRSAANTNGNENVLVVGNPTLPNKPLYEDEKFNQLPPLPGTEKEAKSIANIYNTQALIGDAATETNVVQQMSNARMIHLATTGFLAQALEIPGLLAFTPSSQDDGWLTSSEVNKLKLKADLVVLSTCDSALGKITGDGVIGLSRAFFVAGANSVIGTLGDIPDAPTAELMTEFHKNLSKNSDKAAALRQAMLATMKQHPNPLDWGMFILVGLP
ncbi:MULTISPECIES: CHAT domain-containing protein [Calothrix]|uniref:CHAT domain-containing protein n=2 Tax=Calothrix TaxID=1186 RepID=A0ABR8ABP8_9CYAN|nr:MULTISPECIES: CHAT domain-containing protein [Calothrix]MBD2197402.1 CHAT domain-containing protein [Calothrix parietina FACHB-288]MBD2225969.1 CHAT domain-containing protein [Calothrix anomala FACHB-343]